MAYSELIKSFERIRDYVREFYVYGFRTRGQYDQKSLRSYDNERRRLESYLGGYIGSHRTKSGKNMFLSIDSRAAGSNPLYRVLKSKSFTDGDITLHFILFDILHSPTEELPLSEITRRIDEYLTDFDEPMSFEESTVRKKLAEYIRLGLVRTRKSGRQTLYSRCDSADITGWRDALEFFSEAGVLGAVGSFVLDKLGGGSENFTFKHHYVTHVLESEVLCGLLEAISARKSVSFSYYRRRQGDWSENSCVPLKIFISVQTGRRWVAAYDLERGNFLNFRLDYIRDVAAGEVCPQFGALRTRLTERQEHIWGMSFTKSGRPERVSFTVRAENGEEYILKKLGREKRIGRVERLDENTARFTAYVYDTSELIPWIRNFIGYIDELDFENKQLEKQLRWDTEEMYRMYGIE